MQKRWMMGTFLLGVVSALVISRMIVSDWDDEGSIQPLEPLILYSGTTGLPISVDSVSDQEVVAAMVDDLVSSSEPFDFDMYAVVTFATFEVDQMSSPGQVDASLELLYAHGVHALTKGEPFEELRPWREGEPDLEGWECGDSTRQLLILAMAGDRLKARDRTFWSMHAADALLSCTMCEGKPVEDLYDLKMAWMLYRSAGFAQEARSTALSLGNAYLMAASMRDFSDVEGGSACASIMIDALQTQQTTEDLVHQAIWWMSGEIPDEMIHMVLLRAAEDARDRGREDVYQLILQTIESVWGSSPIYAFPGASSSQELIPL